jgi:phosphoribosylformimino-5-aminoimidazole carboxamide ribotide isomerase
MQIIPVIDLKDGIVVHAKQGDREHYAPIKSKLCASANIVDVIEAYKTHFNFSTIYIADLNAITRMGNNADLLNRILVAYPEITFWIDSGYPLCDDRFHQLKNFLLVLGSESFNDENISEIQTFNKRFVLSLDYSSAGQLGTKTLFITPDFWPRNVIIMSLAKVGSNLGPDLDRLATYRNQYPQQKIIAAGGIRNIGDLRDLEQLGIHQVLLATALHNDNISPNDIANL